MNNSGEAVAALAHYYKVAQGWGAVAALARLSQCWGGPASKAPSAGVDERRGGCGQRMRMRRNNNNPDPWHHLQVPSTHILVVADDLDLPLATVRLRQRGGHGGQVGEAFFILRWRWYKGGREGVCRWQGPACQQGRRRHHQLGRRCCLDEGRRRGWCGRARVLRLCSPLCRTRAPRSPPAQNGLRSIIERLGNTQEFPRLKIGIGRPSGDGPASITGLQCRASRPPSPPLSRAPLPP